MRKGGQTDIRVGGIAGAPHGGGSRFGFAIAPCLSSSLPAFAGMGAGMQEEALLYGLLTQKW